VINRKRGENNKEVLTTTARFFNRKIEFSHRLVFVYTCIIIIPLLALFAYIIVLTEHTESAELNAQCDKAVRDNAVKISDYIHTFSLLETMIETNNDLMLFFTIPENCDEAEIIETTNREATTIERLQTVMPTIYAVRIFADNPFIPERWPVIVSSQRTDLSRLREWELNYSAEYMGNQNALKSLSVCETRRLIKSRREIGWLQISMKMSDFFPFLYKAPEPYQNDYVFHIQKNNNGITLAPVINSLINKINIPLSKKEKERFMAVYTESGGSGIGKISGNGRTHIVSWRTNSDLNIVIVHTCSTEMIMGSIVRIAVIAAFGLLASVLVLYYLINKTTSRLMSGVYSVMNGMKQVREGKFDVQIPVTSTDEVGETQNTFNSMTLQLQDQIEQIKNEQQLIADTEMKAMQNQINAHFLYNVLETIRMQAVLADRDDIAESIMIVGKMLRYCLRWRVHNVTLAQEIEYINSYIYILNIRNDYVISLETDIPEQYETLTIPKMLLQPFVENAFNYAIEPLAKDAVIRIYAEPDPDAKKIWLCVQDYGCGMSREKLEEIRGYLADNAYERISKGNIGIKNIQQRLTMFFGKEYRLAIESVPGKGTLVRVPVPLAFYTELPAGGNSGERMNRE
jgi:two-component system, sensor histidine kinase YesM